MQQLFQVPHTGFPRIAFNHLPERGIGNVELFLQQASPFQQPRHQVVLGDGEFFFADVAGQSNHIHAVEQWPGNGVQLVGGTHEQHLGQVHAYVQVVVQEFLVLFRVQSFQQGRGRVALIGAADLVDLIQHDHRVGHLAVFQGLHEFTGHGADVGAAVAFDFSFIAHTADTEPIKLPAKGIGHRTADGGFAHPRRAD